MKGARLEGEKAVSRTWRFRKRCAVASTVDASEEAALFENRDRRSRDSTRTRENDTEHDNRTRSVTTLDHLRVIVVTPTAV